MIDKTTTTVVLVSQTLMSKRRNEAIGSPKGLNQRSGSISAMHSTQVLDSQISSLYISRINENRKYLTAFDVDHISGNIFPELKT